MADDWFYSVQFYFNKLFGTSSTDPIELISLVTLSVSGILLIGIIHALYTTYKKNKLIETLLFLYAMIFLIIGSVFAILLRFAYRDWGLRGLGDLFTLGMNLFVLTCIVLVNLFSIRVTFPRRYKIVLVILLVLSAIMLYTGLWAAFQGFPYVRVVDFLVFFTLELTLIRFFCLLPYSIIPIALFFYYANKVREEKRAHSNRSIWLGLGILFFDIAVLVTGVFPRLQIIQVLFAPSALIFYVCFSMPEWFKRKIGWID